MGGHAMTPRFSQGVHRERKARGFEHLITYHGLPQMTPPPHTPFLCRNRMHPNATGMPRAYPASMIPPRRRMRSCGPPGTPHTMEGSASMVGTPLRVVQSKGASVDRMTTARGTHEAPETTPQHGVNDTHYPPESSARADGNTKWSKGTHQQEAYNELPHTRQPARSGSSPKYSMNTPLMKMPTHTSDRERLDREPKGRVWNTLD